MGSIATMMLVGGFGALHGQHSLGLERIRLEDPDGGHPALRSMGLAVELPSPTWAARDGDLIYAVLEDTDEVATLRMDRDGEAVELTLLGTTGVPGDGATHAATAVDDLGRRHLLVACYANGHVCVHPLDDDGMVGQATQVLENTGHGPLPAQEGPHAHWVLPLPDGRVLTTDLGTDQIHVHRWRNGRLMRIGSVPMPAGTGPRDLHLMPTIDGAEGVGAWAVAVVGEWGNTIGVLRDAGSDALPGLTQILPLDGTDHDQAASLAFDPRTDIAYAGLRGTERIVAARWNRSKARFDAIDEDWARHGVDAGGKRPRHLVIVGRTLLAADEASDDLAAFHLADGGRPMPADALATGSPTLILPV